MFLRCVPKLKLNLRIATVSSDLISLCRTSYTAVLPLHACASVRYAHSDRDRDCDRIRLVSKATGKKTDLWQLYNEVVYPPTIPKEGEIVGDGTAPTRRPAEMTHRREDILYSQKKLWLLGFMIRGMAVDSAFQQLAFRPEKGARILEEVLTEAIELAVKEHDFEYCTKMWIEALHVSRGRGVPRLHKGVRCQVFTNTYHYANLYIRLREGDPPEVYHPLQSKGTWTPAPNCPARGRPTWGSGSVILHHELERIRQRRLKYDL